MKTQVKHPVTFVWEWSKVIRIRTTSSGMVKAIEDVEEKGLYVPEGEEEWRLPAPWELKRAFADKVDGFNDGNFVAGENGDSRDMYMVNMVNGKWLDLKVPGRGKHTLYLRLIRTPKMGEEPCPQEELPESLQ